MPNIFPSKNYSCKVSSESDDDKDDYGDEDEEEEHSKRKRKDKKNKKTKKKQQKSSPAAHFVTKPISALSPSGPTPIDELTHTYVKKLKIRDHSSTIKCNVYKPVQLLVVRNLLMYCP